MITPHAAHTLIDYHYARWREIWRAIMRLDEATFVQDVPYSQGSLRNQLVHVIDDDAKWMAMIEGRRHVSPLRPADLPTRADVLAHYETNEAHNRAVIHNADEALLQKIHWWDSPMSIVPQQVSGWQILLHVVNHGTDHRAQVLRVLHDFGAPTGDQDFMAYLVTSGHINPSHASGGSDV